jgi:hypothetical protein
LAPGLKYVNLLQYMEGPRSPESKHDQVDVSNEFMRLDLLQFHEFIRALRSGLKLRIEVDLSNITDKKEFVDKTRRLKAFCEGGDWQGQNREVVVHGRRSQKNWEPNVFTSSVQFEAVD